MIAVSMLIFTATTSVLSGLRNAPAAFSAGEGLVISETSAPTIFSSSLDADMVAALESFPEITAVSPEVFAFSSWNGESFVLRGVDLERLNGTGPAFSRFDLVERFSGAGAETALLGERLSGRLGLEFPCTLPVVGSYASKVEFLRVVGVFATGTSLDDEMLVSLDAARFLAGVLEDEVSIIRVATNDPAWLSGVLSPESARFTLFDLHASSAVAATGQPVTVNVGVRNWGGTAGSATVTFSEAGIVLKELEVRLNSSTAKVVQEVFSFGSTGQHSVRVSLSGDFPVKLYANLSVVQPFLRVSAPSKVVLGSSFNVTVATHSGEPVAAAVSFLSNMYVSDASGKATVSADEVGAHDVRANLSGYADGVASVTVVDPSGYPTSFDPAVVSFTVFPSTVQSSEDIACTAVIENNGTVAGTYEAVLYVDSVAKLRRQVSLDGMGSFVWSFDYPAPAAGTRYLQVGNISKSVVVEPWYADNPGLVQLVIRYGGSSSLSSSSEIPIYRAAKISEGNVASTLFAIGAVSAVLSVLAITSAFSKEVAEGRRRLGILRTIGASNSSIRRLVFQQALENGLAGASVGVAFGIVVADRLSGSGVFFLFGHSLRFALDTGLMVLILLGAVLICVSSALASSSLAVRETAMSSIKRTEASDEERLPPEGPPED